jgi:diguanylate cyclase (GGDEF)-like protein
MSRKAAARPTATLLAIGLDVPGAVCCATLDQAAAHLREVAFEMLLASVPAAELLLWSALSQAVLDSAVVALLAEAPDEATQAQLLDRGVQDIVVSSEPPAEALRPRLEVAVQLKALDRMARKAFATDLATGLPNHGQLLEHMTHLLALREREPAPMAVIALRIEGLATVRESLGAESANVLRRKVAVRLRASLRASDLVASIGNDAFVVLLAWTDAPADGERVAAKLVHSLRQPFSVTGSDLALAVSAGLALYPEHGKGADVLLRRAVGQAASLASMGRGASPTASSAARRRPPTTALEAPSAVDQHDAPHVGSVGVAVVADRDQRQLRRVDAIGAQRPGHRVGALGGQGLVVVDRAARIAVALEQQAPARVGLQLLGMRAQQRIGTRFGQEGVAAETNDAGQWQRLDAGRWRKGRRSSRQRHGDHRLGHRHRRRDRRGRKFRGRSGRVDHGHLNRRRHARWRLHRRWQGPGRRRRARDRRARDGRLAREATGERTCRQHGADCRVDLASHRRSSRARCSKRRAGPLR